MKGKNVFFNIAMTLVCFFFIICASTFLILLIKPLYGICAGALDVPATSGVPLEICKKNYSVLIDYNMFWGPTKLIFPDFPMSEHGEIHFMEVKRIFVTMQVTAIVTGILMVPGIFYTKRERAYGWLLGTVILALIVVGTVGGGLIFAWNKTFILMHHILFSNDYWLFDPAVDPVINILPDKVFLAAGAGIVILIIAGLTICAVVYAKKHKKRSRRK